MSECHKPNTSGKNREHEGKRRVMIATKSEMRNNPHMMYFVLLYKDTILSTNNMTPRSSVVSNVLQAFNDVLPEEISAGLPPLRGIEHQIDLIPGASLPNRPPYRTNPEATKEIQRQVQELLDKGYVRESLSPCAVPVILVQRKMVLGECVLIVELLTTSLSDIVIPSLGLMTCLMNLVVLLFSLKLTYVADTIRLE